MSVLLLTAGCRGTQYENVGIGLYPAGAVYANGDWTMSAQVYQETSAAGSMFDRQDKTVWVRVVDEHGNRLLNDKLRGNLSHVNGTVSWPSTGTLVVTLQEEGDAESDDPYSQELAKSGPRTFATLSYRFDAATKKYVRE